MSRIMPALSDGRCFTTWVASCQYDQKMQRKFNTPGDASYRMYLQEHAMAAQDESRKLMVTECAYPFLSTPAPTTAPVPVGYRSCS